MIRSHRKLRGTLLVLFALFFSIHTHLAKAQAPLRDDPDKVIGFAHHLLSQGDSYRAITEYQAFLFLFPHHRRIWEARYFLARAYRAEGHWEEALEKFRQVVQSGPDQSMWVPKAALEVGETLLRAGHPASAARALEEVAQTSRWEKIRQRALYRAAWGWLQARQWGEAVRTLDTIEPADPLGPQAAKFRDEILREVTNLPARTPWIAGGLSAILPGSGHLYVGRPREALTSFLLNGAFIAGSVWAIQKGYPITGGILAFFELGWYLGGISTAARGAHHFNRTQETLLLKKMEERWELPSMEDRPSGLGALRWSLRF